MLRFWWVSIFSVYQAIKGFNFQERTVSCSITIAKLSKSCENNYIILDKQINKSCFNQSRTMSN
jgi:hypothetical protein